MNAIERVWIESRSLAPDAERIVAWHSYDETQEMTREYRRALPYMDVPKRVRDAVQRDLYLAQIKLAAVRQSHHASLANEMPYANTVEQMSTWLASLPPITEGR